jgi:Cu(I)/Ag(I) efflux system membrane fusion protein
MKTRWIFAAVALVVVVTAGVVWRDVMGRRADREESTTSSHAVLYQCSMHPQIVSDKPGFCPICHMRLERVDHGSIAAAPAPESAAASGAQPNEVPGRAPFNLSAERQQLIGVTKASVEPKNLAREIRAAGKVAYDPALYQTMSEYRQAQRARAELKDSLSPEARQGADALVRSAALKLRQQGLSEEHLREMARHRESPLNLLLPSDSVWVYAQVYEYELDLVQPGLTVRVTSPTSPGETYTARVATIDPTLDPTTRTARVRIPLPTPDHKLRPGSFVHVTIEVPLGEMLAVPEDAVLDTGEHQIAFVVNDEGRFEPRSLRLGREGGGYYEVLAGVTAGEQVVTSANFLIDSESRFRAAVAAFSKAPAHVHPQ